MNMKKLFKNLMFLTLGSSFALLYSCGEDEEPLPAAPTLTVTAANASGAAVANGGSIAATDTITFSFTASTPGGFNTLRLTGSASAEFSRTSEGIEAGETAPNLPSISFPTVATDAGASLSINFLLVDDANQVDTVTFAFDITDAPSPEARAYSATILEVITGDLMNAAFFSSSTGMTYSPNDVTSTSDPVSATIDFGYYYGTNDGAALGSPEWFSTSEFFSGQVADWGTLNSINFVSTTLTPSQFVEIGTWADIDEVYDAGTDENQVISNLAVDQVFGFETDADKEGGSKRGLFIVTAITGTDGSDGSITIDVLVQEDAS
jgi:hypothetical protein